MGTISDLTDAAFADRMRLWEARGACRANRLMLDILRQTAALRVTLAAFLADHGGDDCGCPFCTADPDEAAWAARQVYGLDVAVEGIEAALNGVVVRPDGGADDAADAPVYATRVARTEDHR